VGTEKCIYAVRREVSERLSNLGLQVLNVSEAGKVALSVSSGSKFSGTLLSKTLTVAFRDRIATALCPDDQEKAHTDAG
jgi:hypothetical protein